MRCAPARSSLWLKYQPRILAARAKAPHAGGRARSGTAALRHLRALLVPQALPDVLRAPGGVRPTGGRSLDRDVDVR